MINKINDYETVHHKVMELYENSGMTPADLAERSGVPLTSLQRYMKGDSKSPNFFNLCAIILTLGGSVDEIIGVAEPTGTHATADSRYTALLREDLAYARKSKHFWITCFLIMVVILISFLVIDLLNPSAGWIQRLAAVSGANNLRSFIRL